MEINLSIDGIKIKVAEDTSILNAARQAGINIPTLCFHPEQEVKANCRICVVEVKGARHLVPACATPVAEGMQIFTAGTKVIEARRVILQLILSRHEQDCLYCIRSGNCELQKLAIEYGLRENPFPLDLKQLPVDRTTPALELEPDKCILCGRCAEICRRVQSVNALRIAYYGRNSLLVPGLNNGWADSTCVMCGQCIHACPVGAIHEKEEIDLFREAAADPDKVVVAQIAPSVRLAVAETLGLETGSLPFGKFIAALKKLGFDYILPTNFTADLTIMEEGNEFINRMKNGENLPLFTSCCPAWVNFMEAFYPHHLGNLSSCKSPQQMFGSLVKTYWAEKMGIAKEKIYSVSIMPCTAKKGEALRPEMQDSGWRDVDLVLTTREVGRLLNTLPMKTELLPEADFDSWMGEYTGAGVIFGASGGVAEAALRTVYEILSGQALQNLDFSEVRGMAGIKEAHVEIKERIYKIAVVHGLANARRLMEDLINDRCDYDFVEVMSCPGGCVGGGGQPLTMTREKRAERIKAIYTEADSCLRRKSHENKEISNLYAEYLGEPLGEKAHHLLHTVYSPKR